MPAGAGEILGAALLIVGTAFCVLGVYGLVRLPDVYCRLHATGVVITLGAGGVLVSLLLLAPPRAGLKALATAAFLLLTTPMVTHILARAAHRLDVELTPKSTRDDLSEDAGAGGEPSPEV